MDNSLGLLVFFLLGLSSILHWRQCVKLVLWVVVLEGAVRKWILPGMSDFLYFGKDVIMLVAYIKYFFWIQKNPPRFKIRQPGIRLLVSLNLIYGLIEMFNWKLGSAVVGVLGMKAFFFYIPLMYMLPNLFPTVEDMQKFLQRYLLLLIPVCLLGAVQYVSPASSRINTYAGGMGPDAFVGRGESMAVRITATFPYLSGFTSYLIVCTALLVPLMTTGNRSYFVKILNILELVLISGCQFMTGGRTTVGVFVLFLIGFFALSTPSAALRLFRRLFIPGVICFVAALFLFRKPIENFMHRMEDAGGKADIIYRVSWAKEAFTNIECAGIFGYGIGSTHQGTPKLRSMLSLPPGEAIPVYYEDESGRLTLELGLLGLLSWGLLKISILFALWRTYRKLRTRLLRQLALAAFLIHAIMFTSLMVFHVTFCIYYWFLAGFIFLLPKLEWSSRVRVNSTQ
jgi:hypothetical protein